MKKLITAVLLLSTFFFSCNQAVKGEYVTVVVDLGGSASGARAIGQNELPFLKDTHITIEAVGRLSGTFVKEFAPGEAGNIALRLITGDTVRLRVKASNASGIWSGGTTFTVENGTSAVSVKLNKTISGAQALTFSMRQTGTHGINPLYTVNLYVGNKKIDSKDNVLLPPSFCRDAKGRIFVAYYYYEFSREKVDLIRYDSEGNESEKLIEKDWISSPLVLASDLTTKEVYAVRSRELYKVGTGSFKLWPSVDMSHLPYNFSGINPIAAHNGQLFVFGQKNGENNSHLYVYDINLSETSFTLDSETTNTELSVLSTDKSYTDMFVTDDAVYLLRSDYSAVPDSHGKVYSKGALIKYEYNKAKKKIDNREEFGKSDEDDENGIVLTPDTSFYGPLQFIGFDDDVLYIADDGVTFTYFNEAPRITANKNRIASFNTTEKSLSFTDTSATWRSEEKRWKAPDSKIMLWKKAASGSFDYYAVNSADDSLGTPDLTSGSSKYADVFCFDQDGALYIVKNDGNYKVQRFKIGEDGSYELTPWGDTSASLTSLGTSTITAIAGDASGSIEVGGNRYNALYYITNASGADKLKRVLWKVGHTLSSSSVPESGYDIPLSSSGVPTTTLDVTALAANKDGVFIATKETSGNTYTLKVYKLAHTDTALPGTSLTVGTGTLSVPTITYDEQITALQIQDGVLYGISTKTKKKENIGKTVAFTMSGKLLKLGSTDGSFTGTLTIDTALLYGQKDVDASSDGAFAPYRFIALKPKKLVIASDGGYGQNGTAENKNRVLTFTLDGSGNTGASASFDVVPAVNFSKEMRYDDAGGVGCGFMWN